MGRRNKTSPVEDFIAVASKLPWWAALLLAVISYLALHAYANQPITVSTVPGEIVSSLVPLVLKGLATVGQFILPLLFGIAAILSWLQQRRHGSPQTTTHGSKSEVSRGASHQSPSCPVCSSAMVLRQAKRGSNTGKSFWGCSTFPQCKGTRTSD